MIAYDRDLQDDRGGVRIRGAEVLVVNRHEGFVVSVYDPESADGANHFAIDRLGLGDVYSSSGTTGTDRLSASSRSRRWCRSAHVSTHGHVWAGALRV